MSDIAKKIAKMVDELVEQRDARLAELNQMTKEYADVQHELSRQIYSNKLLDEMTAKLIDEVNNLKQEISVVRVGNHELAEINRPLAEENKILRAKLASLSNLLNGGLNEQTT
jgi:predicted nuclease with TOPRIM domain